MHRNLGPGLAHEIDQAGVSHDQRVGFERHHRRHVGQVAAHFGVMRQHVADDEELFAASVRLGDGAAQRFQVAELVVAHAQAVARLSGIDGVGAEGEGVLHHRQRTGGGEQFRRLRGGFQVRDRHGGFTGGKGRMQATRILTVFN